MPLNLNGAPPQRDQQQAPPRERYIPTDTAHQAVQGREDEVVRALGIHWHGSSGHIRCPYPNHEDRNPSWRLMDSGQAVCSAPCVCGGKPHSVFDVAMYLESINFEAAKIRVIEAIGRQDLVIDPNAKRQQQQGLTLAQFAEAKRLPVEWLRLIGLTQGSYGPIPAVWIPFLNEHGQRQTIQFRVSLTGDKNQLFKKGTTVCLYGAHQAPNLQEAGYVVIVEGVSDTLILWYHGIPAVGLPGAGGWNEERDAHLFDGVPVIFVVIEPDKGGEATIRWLSRSSIAPRVRLVHMAPSTKDPSALYLADPDNFRTAFQAALDAAEPFPEEMIVKPDKQRKTANANRPTITVFKGRLHEAADEGLEAMHSMGIEFYQRDRAMVRVARIKAKASDGSDVTTPGIVLVTLPMLRRAMGQSARWEKYNDKHDLITIDPPKDVVEQIAAMVGEWPFHALVGVINVPLLRPDGSLLLEEGYDEATGFALLAPPKMPAIPDRPTKDDAVRALTLLEGLLQEFPFVGGKDSESKSVALSKLMTPVLRPSLQPAVPIHLVTKPAAGTGGSYLSDVASAIATGEKCAVMSLSKNPEETEKRLIGAAISGRPIIALDNSGTPLDGDFLCQVSERPILELRPLGTSQTVRLANSFTVFANGNHASVTNDVVRRTIVCSLDANMEAPWTREFKQDPFAMVLADRGKYIAAILTMARAYIVAGRPGKLKPLASYPGWSDIVRSALVWLDKADPVATMAASAVEDEPRQQRAAVFRAWATEYVPNASVSTADLIEAADAVDTYGWIRPALRDALLAVAEQRGPMSTKSICSRRLGKWLANNVNNISGAYKLTPDRSDQYRPKWRLEKVG